jgi:hypothetical protein
MEKAAAYRCYKLYKFRVTDKGSTTQLVDMIVSEHRTFSCVNTRVYSLQSQELHSPRGIRIQAQWSRLCEAHVRVNVCEVETVQKSCIWFPEGSCACCNKLSVEKKPNQSKRSRGQKTTARTISFRCRMGTPLCMVPD